MPSPRPRPLGAIGAAALAVLLLGNSCQPLKGVRIDAPAPATLFTGDPVDATGRLGRNLDLATATVELNGVDLVTALALAPPFSDASGVVVVGPDTVTVTGFDLAAPAEGPRLLALTVSGLSDVTHTLTVTAYDPGPDTTKLATTEFTLVDSFSVLASDAVSAGLPIGPLKAGTGTLVNLAVGQAIASPPIATASGATIESGLPEVSAEIAD